MKAIATLAILLPIVAAAQASGDAAAPLSGAELQARLAGKKFSLISSSGALIRLQYDADGTLYVTAPGGRTRSGKWSTQDGRICSQFQGLAVECSDIKPEGESLQVKRSDAAWAALVPN